jgi:sec-independent protein translocase protein TatB
MFDIGFLELFVIGIIALIVLGPERLPKAARTIGLWVAKAKQSFNSVKNEIDRELQVKELQQQINNQKAQLAQQMELDSLQEKYENAKQSMQDLSSDFGSPLTSNKTDTTASVNAGLENNEVEDYTSHLDEYEPLGETDKQSTSESSKS